jgi:Secretion system C-terminal sorting domain/Metallo-peptidase family M12B Reprolysin-like
LRYDALGVAFLGAEVGSSSGVVQQRSANGFGGSHTFAHEVGHLMGAHHDLIDEDNPTPGFANGFNHGIYVDVEYGWFGPTNKKFATAMCTPFVTNGRRYNNVLNFSSPMQSVSGEVLGDANCCDNTRTILENASHIRELTSEPNFTVSIFGEYWITNYGLYNFEPIIHCGQAPFTSEWKLFIDGVFIRTETLPNDAQFYLFSSPLDIVGDGSSVEIFLKVTDNNGQILNAYRNLYVYYPHSDLIDPNKNHLQKKANYVELIYPNPVSDKFVFEYELEAMTNVDISILSSNGKLVQNRKIEKGIGHFSQKFDVSNLPAGMYILKALMNEKTVTQKFTVVK